jgi:hypothetical protein
VFPGFGFWRVDQIKVLTAEQWRKTPDSSGFGAGTRLDPRLDGKIYSVRRVTLIAGSLCDGQLIERERRSFANRREMMMKKLLIAATICLLAGTNFASAANAASAHRAQRSGGSMQSIMSRVMGSGMMSSIGGMIPGGIPGADSGGLGQSPASIGTLPSGGYGPSPFE